jgi:superfamily I DNA and/or RNA helicase
LQRILDAFFDDIDRVLFSRENIQKLKKIEMEFDYDSLDNVIDIITEFSNIIINNIESLYKSNEKYKIDNDKNVVKKVITSYQKFICEFYC